MVLFQRAFGVLYANLIGSAFEPNNRMISKKNYVNGIFLAEVEGDPADCDFGTACLVGITNPLHYARSNE